MNSNEDEAALAARKFAELTARKAEHAAAQAADEEAARKSKSEAARETVENYGGPPWLALGFTAILAIGLLLLVERLVLAHQVEACMSEHRPDCDQIVDQSMWKFLW